MVSGGGHVGGSGVNNVGVSGHYGVVPLEEEMYTPPMTQSRT